MASHALPPFLPKRKLGDYPCGDEICLVNSYAFSSCNASFVSYLTDSDSSDSDLEESEPSGVAIRRNLRRVLGDVLEQLDADDEFDL